uniref:RING finger protein 207 n=5 Tax=Parascaris univalens TaxID=6257 RepID=A0A915AEQ5_PARUN
NMACSRSLLMFKLENSDSRNPLECLICDREFTQPIRLSCQHSYCHDCIDGRSMCPICGNLIDGDLLPDSLLSFLIDTSHETTEICANCDQISQPMHFCETCQQALCNRCRQNTHQAKMFAAHRLVPLEERARVKGRLLCPQHGEPFILYSIESRSLACIVCFNNATLDSRHHLVHIDAAHKIGCEKLEKAAAKLRNFQDNVREQFQLRKRLASELSHSYRNTSEHIRQTCQEMIDTLLTVRDGLIKKLDDERTLREKHFHEQMRQLISLQPLIRLYLLSASIFFSSASKLDFLQSSTDLMKRIQNLMSMECDKPLYTGELTVDSREEFGRALEPFLGLSTILFSTGRDRGGDTNDTNCGTASPRNHNSYVRRSGSGYMNGSCSLSTKYQLVVDLAGAFGEQFAKVETPLRQYNREITRLSQRVQEMQKDLTLRRCIIDKEIIEKLIRRCVDLDTRVGQQSALINDLQPQLQQIWQEQLDRVRRQQILFREKIEEMIILRENARHVSSAARQLEPFAVCLAAVSSIIDRRRCHPPDPAPMESLCLQINTIEPDSQHRIEAIEKEEQNRRLAQDQKKREEQLKFASAKKQLKTTKEQKILTRESTRNSASKARIVNTTRDRSRGGTDRALLSPCNRRHKGSSLGSRCSKSQSDPEEFESSMDDSFEFIAESSFAEAETTKFECEHTLCRSQPLRLSTPIPMRSKEEERRSPSSSSLPDDEQLSKRVSEINLTSGAKCLPCENRKNGAPIIPKVPFVPKTLFDGLSTTCGTLGAWESWMNLSELSSR